MPVLKLLHSYTFKLFSHARHAAAADFVAVFFISIADASTSFVSKGVLLM